MPSAKSLRDSRTQQDIQELQRGLLTLESIYRYRHTGEQVYFAVDFSEIFAYITIAKPTTGFFVFAADWEKDPKKFAQYQKMVLNQMYREQEIGKLILLSPYVDELVQFLSKKAEPRENILDIVKTTGQVLRKLYKKSSHLNTLLDSKNDIKIDEAARSIVDEQVEAIVEIISAPALGITLDYDKLQWLRNLFVDLAAVDKDLTFNIEEQLAIEDTTVWWKEKLFSPEFNPRHSYLQQAAERDALALSMVEYTNSWLRKHNKKAHVFLVSRSNHMHATVNGVMQQGSQSHPLYNYDNLVDYHPEYCLLHPRMFNIVSQVHVDALNELNQVKDTNLIHEEELNAVINRITLVNKYIASNEEMGLIELKKDWELDEQTIVAQTQSQAILSEIRNEIPNQSLSVRLQQEIKDQDIVDWVERLRTVLVSKGKVNEVIVELLKERQNKAHTLFTKLTALQTVREEVRLRNQSSKPTLELKLTPVRAIPNHGTTYLSSNEFPYLLEIFTAEAQKVVQVFEESVAGSESLYSHLAKVLAAVETTADILVYGEVFLIFAVAVASLNDWQLAEVCANEARELTRSSEKAEKEKLLEESDFFYAICLRKNQKARADWRHQKALRLLSRTDDKENYGENIWDLRFAVEQATQILLLNMYFPESNLLKGKGKHSYSPEHAFETLRYAGTILRSKLKGLDATKEDRMTLRALVIQILNNRLDYCLYKIMNTRPLSNIQQELCIEDYRYLQARTDFPIPLSTRDALPPDKGVDYPTSKKFPWLGQVHATLAMAKWYIEGVNSDDQKGRIYDIIKKRLDDSLMSEQNENFPIISQQEANRYEQFLKILGQNDSLRPDTVLSHSIEKQ